MNPKHINKTKDTKRFRVNKHKSKIKINKSNSLLHENLNKKLGGVHEKLNEKIQNYIKGKKTIKDGIFEEWHEYNVVGDGNCGYYAIILGILINEIKLPDIIDGISYNFNNNNYENLTVENLRKITGKPYNWLNTDEIQLLSNKLNICIYVINHDKSEKFGYNQIFSQKTETETNKLFTFTQQIQYFKQENKLIFLKILDKDEPKNNMPTEEELGNILGNHYTLLIPNPKFMKKLMNVLYLWDIADNVSQEEPAPPKAKPPAPPKAPPKAKPPAPPKAPPKAKPPAPPKAPEKASAPATREATRETAREAAARKAAAREAAAREAAAREVAAREVAAREAAAKEAAAREAAVREAAAREAAARKAAAREAAAKEAAAREVAAREAAAKKAASNLSRTRTNLSLSTVNERRYQQLVDILTDINSIDVYLDDENLSIFTIPKSININS